MIRRVLAAFLTSILPLLAATTMASAHADVCHNNHSCPSDDNTYVCGDLGFCTQCTDNLYCLNQAPRPGTPQSAAAAAAAALGRLGQPVPAAAPPPPAAPPPVPPTTSRPPASIPQPSALLTPEQLAAIARAGGRTPGAPGPAGSVTNPTPTPQQIATLLTTLPPDLAAALLSQLTPEQLAAVLALLPPGTVLPAALPRTGADLPLAPALALAGMLALVAGMTVQRSRSRG